MGLEQCTTHGRQSGPLCCSHVQAVAHGAGGVLPNDTVELVVDLTDTSAHILPHIVCASCAREFGLVAHTTVSGALAERVGEFPSVAPTCQVCVDIWRNSLAPQVGDA